MNLFAEDEYADDDVLFADETDADEETEYSVDYDADNEDSGSDEEDDLFADDFAIEDFQFAFDDDEDDENETADIAYVEADEFEELDLDALDDIANDDLLIPRSEYEVPMVFEMTLEELMEMTDEY